MDEFGFHHSQIKENVEEVLEPTSDAVRCVRSIFPTRLIITGPVTGRRYEFPNHGHVIEDVDAADAEKMVGMTVSHKSCCNNAATVHYYVEYV